MTSRLQFYSIGLVALSGACSVRTPPVPQIAYIVSSEGSQYSPTATLRLSSARDGSRLRIDIDTATLTVPGNFAVPAPIALQHVYLSAYIATTNERPMALALPDTGRFPDRRGWRALSGSDSILLAEDLRHGERRSLSRLHFSLPLPPVTPTPQWLVFRISGKVVDYRMTIDERSGLHVGPPGGSARVYVCSERDLLGQPDPLRAENLRRAYNLSVEFGMSCSFRGPGIELRITDLRGDVVFAVATGIQPYLRYCTLFMTDGLAQHADKLIASCKCHFLRNRSTCGMRLTPLRRSSDPSHQAQCGCLTNTDPEKGVLNTLAARAFLYDPYRLATALGSDRLAQSGPTYDLAWPTHIRTGDWLGACLAGLLGRDGRR